MATLKNFQNRAYPAPQVNLDRVCICAGDSERTAFRHQPMRRVLRSHFLRSGFYGRILETQDGRTGARTLFYDQPRVSWVSKTKVVLRAGDAHGLGPADLLGALELLNESRLSLFELAFDFPEQVRLNTGFVMEHVLFGKSRWTRRKPGIVWFGARRSAKYVRAYLKPELNVFRIELEFHAAWLRRHKIYNCFDFRRIPELVLPRHLFFCELNWDAVTRRIRESVPNARLAITNLTWEEDDIHATLRFLRNELHFTNTHRFLIPLPMFNDPATRALEVWAGQWPNHPFKLSKIQRRKHEIPTER
jgi:hypothetical protein